MVCDEQKDRKYCIPVLLFFIMTLPIWANVQAFYTDGMSFAIGIVVLALLKSALLSCSKAKAGMLLGLAGLLAGIGMAVKVTIAIPLIAGFIVFVYCGQLKKGWILVCFLTVSLGTYGMTTLWAENYEIWEEAQETCEPVIDWIALGMKGDGSYGSNLEYIYYVSNLPSKAEKAKYTRAYIWENRREFWNVSHLIQKLRCNFASGNFGTKDYTYYTVRENNVIWELFSPWGKYYWRTSQICFCYIFAVYATYLAGAVCTLSDLIKKREISAVKMIADLALLGNIVFLMIWEANNRQLYNQIPIILVGGVWNARRVTASVEAYWINIRNKRRALN